MDKLSTGRSKLSLVASLLLLALAVDAFAAKQDLNTAWQDYADQRALQPPAFKFPHATCFSAAALQYELPESLLLAVARGESDFEATARSRANAHGVMQILWPGTAKHLGIHRLSDLYDPCTNIDAGARYLKELLAHYDGNLHLALAAYNYGPGRIAQDGSAIPSGANWYSGYIFR
ncbi:MAG: lytic transglycosylase domain-containing protein, partial [Gammaproteobacteria bacterium]|nr:lytic transglycosylase domain-containing protein [Gammaproteobacteria bacterium]